MDRGKAAAECRRQAADFKLKAEGAWLPANREFFLDMARYWLVLARSYELNECLGHTTERLNELGTRIEIQCDEIDAQCRQIGLQCELQRRERARASRQFTGLRLVVSN